MNQTKKVDDAELLPILGVRLGIAQAAIRKIQRDDLTLIELCEGTRVAGVFTRNAFSAAPVKVCRDHLKNAQIRALVINTGVANAGTGEQGVQDALHCCQVVADLLSIETKQVLPFSTGVILEPLPVDKLCQALPNAQQDLNVAHWQSAAHAIMTTDTVAKSCSRQIQLSNGSTVNITGISKGSGMIRPNMATMLAFIATDAHISQEMLERILANAASLSFNSITIDGDCSTNDSFMLMATGQAGNAEISCTTQTDYAILNDAITEVAIELAQAIARDGEGATKFITVQVEHGQTLEECRQVAYSIAHSPLVKTAFFASDPNLGRILCAIGYSGIANLDVQRIKLWLSDGNYSVLVAEKGGRALGYQEQEGVQIMQSPDIYIRVDLDRGQHNATIWTCDFSYDYVKINADYRS